MSCIFFFSSNNEGTTYTAQLHNHQHILPSGSGAWTHSAPSIPTNTSHFTQQPSGMDSITYYPLDFSGNSMHLNLYGVYVYNTCEAKLEA